MPRAEPTDRIRQLEESRARINAEIQRVKGRAQQAERKRETRRKILVGSMVLGLVKRGEWPEERLKAALDRFLERELDRALFELPPKAPHGEDSEAPFVQPPPRIGALEGRVVLRDIPWEPPFLAPRRGVGPSVEQGGKHGRIFVALCRPMQGRPPE